MESKKKNSMTAQSRDRLIFYICILAYPILHYLIFYVGVNINSVLLAFKEYDEDAGVYRFLGFGNFQAFFTDMISGTVLLTSLKNSMILWGVTVFIGLPLNLLFSFFLFKQVPLNGVFRVVLYLPQILSAVVMSMMYKYFLDRGLPYFLTLIGIKNVPNFLVDNATAYASIVVFNVWTGFGMQVVVYSSAMSRVSQELIESGEIDGMNTFQELIFMVLPMIYPTITLFVVSGIAGIFTNQAALYNFFQDQAENKLYTLGYFLFVQVVGRNSTLSDYPYAAAAGVSLTLVAAPLTLLVKWLMERFDPVPEA